ncbi:MAG: winged helix-turn-helix domain-containing protein [Bacteroidaceae bacterium]|jgi:hypothetical protein|nr:winged helix-turn-helix domain-containing protein [Bacteroidaceae bacterium]MBR1543015.1 winged helix-turn-helix domain-containing protein [Bacteroidaceae bacterium]
MKKDDIGVNAGLVWRTLFYKGSRATFNELLEKTRLNAIDLSSAIGWLAREDKVEFFHENGEEYMDVYRENYY